MLMIKQRRLRKPYGEDTMSEDATTTLAPLVAPIGENGDPSPELDFVTTELWQSVGFLLNKAAHQIERRFAEALRSHEIAPREYGVLASIARQGPQSQQQLGERLGIDRTTMVNIIDSLEDGDLVTRIRDRVDRRRYAITLSAKGERLIHGNLFDIDVETHDSYLAVLQQSEREQLFDILRRLVKANS
jgi:DNA-binding MarR family transcriptional regulator